MTTFEFRAADREYGWVDNNRAGTADRPPGRRIYRLLRCAGCGRGGLSTALEDAGHRLEEFYPPCASHGHLPGGVPDDIVKEYREAEKCASVDAFRGASALLRSALEKALKANGYKEKLHPAIEAAAKEGLITAVLEARAKDDIKNFANDVLHDPWFPVTPAEYEISHGFVRKVIECFYDDRPTAEVLLRKHKRVP